MLKKIIYVVIIIVLVIAGVFVAKKIANKEETVETTTNKINEVKKTEEENNILENEAINEAKEDQKTETSETPEDRAKEIVKNNWGEDDSVYYSFDGKDNEGNYIICVRDKNTTKALYFYYVDIESGSFTVK